MKTKSASAPFIDIRQENDRPSALLRGAWTIYNAASIEDEITAALKGQGTGPWTVDTGEIGEIDTAGAWLIKKHFNDNAELTHVTRRQAALLAFLPDMFAGRKHQHKIAPPVAFFNGIGKASILGLEFFYALMAFIGAIFIRLLKNFLQPRRFRFPSIIRHIDETGIRAIPIVALLAGLMSMVISYQAAMQLQKFGADIFTIDLSVISILREMGVLITAIMVAGRSGSAFAAEIGVMKLREEVDALKTIGMDPIEVLVLPRLIAMVIALPLLTFIADVVGLAGAGLMSLILLDIPLQQYFDRAQGVATLTMFFVGMIKAPVFAFLVAVIGTYQGMSVSGSAESVGRLTTVAVVQSIFLVILADALFSIVFSKMGI